MMATEALAREIDAVRVETGLRPVWIRVTPTAIPGAPVALPLTPERGRTLGLLLYDPEEGTVDADPRGRPVEIVVHDTDWLAAMREIPDAWGGPAIRIRWDQRDGQDRFDFCGIWVRGDHW